LTVSVAQEMWRQFAGGAREGEPVALNIGMVGTFRATDAQAVTAAIRQVVARYEALRLSFRAEGDVLVPWRNEAASFAVEQEDLQGLSAEAAAAAALQGAQQFCARLNAIEGGWLTRAKVFALPDNTVLAAMSSAHMIADAGTRNIVLDELRDILETGAPQAAASVPYNDYALAERRFLEGPQGAALIEHWRRWYHDQPTMTAPDGRLLLWGNGLRSIRNFAIPRRVLDRARGLAESLKVTPFLVYLTLFAIALARWSKLERFPVRVLGDKRISLDLSGTVGLMFCADAVEMDVPPGGDFETVLRAILAAYDSAIARRIPSLHFWAPHCVRPGIEARYFPNRIPAVFNYYSVGTAREKAEKRAGPDATAALPWPPEMARIPDQIWPRRSAPVFLHLMDYGSDGGGSLHFFGVSEADQESFIAILFQVFGEVVPV
ncbi:MAG TPA: condensation domain-containing protein, partial [Rhizomicrobium sp.]